MSECKYCNQPAEKRTCETCGKTAYVIDCGHSAQPVEIAADGKGGGRMFCEQCNLRYMKLSATHTVTIVDPSCSVKFEFRDGEIVCEDSAGCDLDHIFRGVDIAAFDKMSADEVRALVLEKWSKDYDGDPDNIEITVE